MLRRFGLFVVAMVLGAGMAEAEETMTLRNFDAFEFDTTTAEGAWMETLHFFLREKEELRSIEMTANTYSFLARLVYGQENVEGGILIPYLVSSASVEVLGVTEEEDLEAVGNLSIYSKVVPIETELFKAGLGLELELPSGDIGSDDVGLIPFFAVSETLGQVEVTQHLGYQFFPGNSDKNAEALSYGGSIRTATAENFALRIEIVGVTQFAEDEEDEDTTLVTFEPGIDFRIPAERFALFIRPSGLVGLTDDAPDWGAGGSLAVNF